MRCFDSRWWLAPALAVGLIWFAAAGASAQEEAAAPTEEAAAVDEAPAEEAAAPAAVAFAEMPVADQIAALQESSLKLNDDGTVASTIYGDTDALWTCLAAFLVFFMQAGFALVETGFTRAKNACNIIMKNLMDFSIGTLAFWMVGFGLMFGVKWNNFAGSDDFFFDAGGNSFGWAFLIFQTVFCATAATIVSGAMAERTKFASYLIYSVAITAIVYPIYGSWAWGGLWGHAGWLEAESIKFHDFAGSTVVHSIGGWCALAGAIVLGPRLGKYVNGKVMPIPGHNIPLAALGVFILWLGWFGFNPGSTTAVGGGNFAFIAVTTNVAAAAGSIGGLICSWVAFKKPDPSFALNGALAGLVAITAGCDVIPVPFAALTGLVAGVLVVGSVVLIDRVRIDDPVGAISVHGVCGAWGTLATGLFMGETGLVFSGDFAPVTSQLIGIGAAFAWAFPVSLCIFLAIKYTVGLRVSEHEEMEGLDIMEHGMLAYPPGFVADTVTGRPLTPAGVAMPHVAPMPSASMASAKVEGA